MGTVKRMVVLGAIALGSLWARGAGAQSHAHDSRMYFDYGDPLMSSVIQTPDGRSADVRLTTANSMFSFQRTKQSPRGGYFAIRDVTVEVVEEGNAAPVLTHNQIDTIYVSNFEQSTSKEEWHALSQKIDLPQLDTGKKYSLRVEVRDGIDRLVMPPIVSQLIPRSFSNKPDASGIAIGDIMLADSMKGPYAATSARGNTYMFSRDVIATCAFRLADSLSSDPIVDIHVRQISNVVNPGDTGERGRMAVAPNELHNDSTFVLSTEGHSLTYTLARSSDRRTWTAIFSVPGKTFEQGKYDFTVRVKAGDVQQTRTNCFNIVWQNMPISLEDPTNAIEPLQYIMTKDEFSQMQSGSRLEMTKKLYDYWRKQDPTPGTAFNERMAAFYQRVDYADFNFATTRLLDGVMTDRGKIYLLYGPPTETQRTFIPGDAPVESWTYSNNVKRQFRFEEHARGDYKLTDVSNMAATN